jgi:hypothetical protein
MYTNKWESNDKVHYTKAASKEANLFADAQMDISSSAISFSNLPDMSKTYCAMITNGEGEFVKQKRISPDDNQVSVNRLGKGLYFVTIVYKNKGQKTFVMNR